MKTLKPETITDIFINGILDGYQGRSSRVDIFEELTNIMFCFDNEENAGNFASNFPGYCKAKVSKISHMEDKDGNFATLPTVRLNIDNKSTDGTTGEHNEAAQKRKDKVFEIFTENNEVLELLVK